MICNFARLFLLRGLLLGLTVLSHSVLIAAFPQGSNSIPPNVTLATLVPSAGFSVPNVAPSLVLETENVRGRRCETVIKQLILRYIAAANADLQYT